MSNTNVIIFARVSTARQDTDRQVHELTAKAKASGWNVVKVITEKISGAADTEARTGLMLVKDLIAKGNIHKVMVHEITRVARRPSVIHAFLDYLHENKVSLYWHQENLETLKPNGKINPMSNLILNILTGLAENERETLKERVLSGLDDARRKGVVLGRPKGFKDVNFLKRHQATVTLLERHPNATLPELKTLSGKSVGTILKIRREMEQKGATV